MDLDTYLTKHEKAKDFAIKIEAKESDLSSWRHKKRPVPIRKCIKIEIESNGLVDRKETRPKDWHIYWPELTSEHSNEHAVNE